VTKTTKTRLEPSRLKPQRRLYWAYGSNLSVANMTRRCPAAVKYSRLYVNNGLLTFRPNKSLRGVADVKASKDRSHVVAGGLWWITAECEASLDRCEGYPHLYVKRYLTLSVNGEVQRCMFYTMVVDCGLMAPFDSYVEVIAEGYGDFGLDLRLLRAAVRRSRGRKGV
jgi:hypothetical protein